MYEERFYRDNVSTPRLVSFTAIVDETDLRITADKNLSKEALESIRDIRKQIIGFSKTNESFIKSLAPLDIPGQSGIIDEMIWASKKAGVGPMAAVAGVTAEYVAKQLLKDTKEIIIENGGDIYMKTLVDRRVSVYAGESPLSNKVCIEIEASKTPIGICTSSGTVGHSLSFGKADAVVILSKSTALADAVATATCNRVKAPEDIPKGIEFARSIEGVDGVLIIMDDKLGLWGDIKLVNP